MGSRRFSLGGAILIILLGTCLIGISQVFGQAAAEDDIQIGTPAKGVAMILTPTPEGGVLNDEHHGDPMTVQTFVFNPATHEVGIAPGKQRAYGNTRIDAAYYKSDLNIFDYVTTDKQPIGKITLTVAGKKILIAPNYVISRAADKPAPIDPATYCANVAFEKGDECNKPGTTVTMHRNADAPTPIADGVISKIKRKTDVITWSVERDGKVLKTGSFGFPVVATEPDLVKYVIQLP